MQHCIWMWPTGEDDSSGRWRALEKVLAKTILTGEHRSAARQRRAERDIRQRRFREITVRDERDFALHMDYVRFNPVKHGLVASAADWPYCSFNRRVTRGLYPADWAGGGDLHESGERS